MEEKPPCHVAQLAKTDATKHTDSPSTSTKAHTASAVDGEDGSTRAGPSISYFIKEEDITPELVT